MPRATCRCGEILTFPLDGPERIVCPKCGARIRVRRSGAPRAADEGDGYLRFGCPCGRRLKVRIDEETPESGMCPACGRIVPVPASRASSQNLPTTHPEAITEELSAADLANLEQWKQNRLASRPAPDPGSDPDPAPNPAANLATTAAMPVAAVTPATELQSTAGMKVEAGLRICPRCRKPVHLSAIVCRECGAHVPKR
jgi:hypothetical protein